MPNPTTIGAFTANTARLSLQGDFSPNGVTDQYTVYVENSAARLDLADVTGLPEIGAKHPLDNDLTVSELRVREHQPGELLRVVEAVYTRGMEESEGSGSQSTSIGKLVALDYPVYTQTGDLVQDQVAPSPVLNSAGDVFDSVPQFETLFTGVHFTRRVADFPSAALALSGSVNSAQVKIYGLTFEPRTARARVTARYTFDGSKRPWELDVTIEPRHNFVDTNQQYRGATIGSYTNGDIGWDVAILDCGFQYLHQGEKIRFTVLAENGTESAPQLPQRLKADGDDGRAYSNESYLIVRTAPGQSWAALKADRDAP